MKIFYICIIFFTYLINVNNALTKPCSLKYIVKDYKKGITSYNNRNYQKAWVGWFTLAEAGFGPAQRQIARMYATGIGVKISQPTAYFWAKLARNGGDLAGSQLSSKLEQKLSPQLLSGVKVKVEQWKSKSLTCSGERAAVVPQFNKFNYKVVKNKRISRQNSQLIDKHLNSILKVAAGQNLANNLYLNIIDQFNFYNGSRYDRYVGWMPLNKLKNKNLNILKVSVSNFYDIKPDYFARAILFSVKRRIFGYLPDSKLIDPFMRVIKGKRIFGSVYPDIKNAKYFKMMNQAFEMGEQLPKSLRRFIDIIDEIHYNPASKFYRRSGTIDAKGAFYIKSLSSEGHRLMFVRRKVLFSSPLFFLQTFVHEGTHAVQDQMAYKKWEEVKRNRRVIRNLELKGTNLKKINDLKNKNRVKLKYVNRWYRGIKTKEGRIQDIKFECEATQNEVKAVKIIGASPDIMKGSGYIKLCPEAQRQVIKWRDEISNLKRKNIR